MKEQILAELLPMVQETKEGLLAVSEALKIRFPELVSQILTWESSIGVLAIILGFGALAVGLISIGYYCKHDDEFNSDVFAFIGLLLSAFSLVIVVVNLIKVIQIFVTPNLYLVKYSSNLLN
jgi:hypothetical protein